MKVSKNYSTEYFLSMGGIIFSVIIVSCFGYSEIGDSYTYISAWSDNLSNGHLDPCRTPVYPLIIGGCKYVFGDSHYKIGVVFLQHLISILSCVALYKLSQLLVLGGKLSVVIAIIYLFLADISWNSFIMTESLACSGTVLVAYFTVKMYYTFEWKYLMLLSTSLLFAIMLRPAQIYLLAVVSFMLILSWKKSQGKRFWAGIFSCVAIFLVIGLYAIHYNRTYGFIGISDVSDINQYYILRSENIVTPAQLGGENSDANEKRLQLGDYSVIYEEAGELLKKNGYDIFHKEIGDVVSKNRGVLLKKMFGRFYRAKDDSLIDHSPVPVISTALFIFSPHFNFVYITLIIFFIYLIRICKNKGLSTVTNVLWHPTFFFCILLANVATIIIAAQSGWGRLVYPSMSIILLMYGLMLNKYLIKQ